MEVKSKTTSDQETVFGSLRRDQRTFIGALVLGVILAIVLAYATTNDGQLVLEVFVCLLPPVITRAIAYVG